MVTYTSVPSGLTCKWSDKQHTHTHTRQEKWRKLTKCNSITTIYSTTKLYSCMTDLNVSQHAVTCKHSDRCYKQDFSPQQLFLCSSGVSLRLYYITSDNRCFYP